MKGNQSQAISRMWAAGLSAQSSVYGQTIPVFYGTTRSAGLLLIWMQELRKGSSGKKAKKKNQTTYVENVDFLIGHNPIAGCLQVWHDADTKLPLNFVKQTFTPAGNITISDPNFYAVVAVTVDISYSQTFNDYGSQGSSSVSGTYELPLWNVNYAGPDPTNQSGYRWSPWVYEWVPGSGPNVGLPYNGPDLPWGSIWVPTVNVYYAQLDASGFASQGKFKGEGSVVPITALRLEFEEELGDGNEYSTPGNFTADQIIYPMYAGLGSPDLDLGTSGSVPIIRPEIMGSFVLNPPRGDADLMDMVEDIFKSGPAQTTAASSAPYGEIHHGLGCLDYPGAVQKQWVAGLEAFDWNAPTFYLPNALGDFLVTIYSDAGSSLTGASDTLGNTYTNVFASGGGFYAGYAPVTTGGFPNAASIAGRGGVLSGGNDWDQTILEIAGLDTLDSATYYNGAAGVVNLNITTTQSAGQPCYIVVATRVGPGLGSAPNAPLHWNALTRGTAWHWTDARLVKFPGTYNYKITLGTTWQSVVFVFKNSQPVPFPNPLGNLLDDGPMGTMQETRNQCRANGLIGSFEMDSQRPAKDYLDDILYAGNAAPVWSGFSLKVIPWSEVSVAGNGAIYVSPTASGPIANLTESDFIGGPTDPPVTIERKARIDPPNLQQLQHPNRNSDYNEIITAQPDNGAISFYGTRKDSPKILRCIQDATVARMLLGIQIRRANTLLNTYKFKLNAKWKLLEPMDLITIPISATMPTNPQNPPTGTIALRLTSVAEDEKFQLDCEAEQFVYGLNAPIAVPVTTPNPYVGQIGADPGPVNTPIFIEPVPSMYAQQNQQQLWIPVSCPSSLFGGAAVYLSTDGGTTYNLMGQTTGNAVTGVSTADWPAHGDPDTTNSLALDLSESLGTLSSFSTAERDKFIPLFWINGGVTAIPYELGSYNDAVLTSPNNYTITATGPGNEIRRAVFSAPQATNGVDHPSSSRFCFLGPNDTGIFKLTMDPTWVGVALKFKFLAFNTFGASSQTLSGATVYTYTPIGTTGSVNPNGLPPGIVTVN